jgi:hypothetical protein
LKFGILISLCTDNVKIEPCQTKLFRLLAAIIRSKAAATVFDTFVQIVLICVYPPRYDEGHLSALQGGGSNDIAEASVRPSE